MAQTIVAVEDLNPKKDSVLRVEWNLGKRCNFDCSYCGASTHNATSLPLAWEVIDKTLSKLAEIGRRQRQQVKLSLTGGEPFLHPRINDILTRAKELGVSRMSVTTNGSVHIGVYKKALPYIDYWVVSYHLEYSKRQKVLENVIALHDAIFRSEETRPAGASLHVHIMLLPGHFDEALSVAETLKARAIPYVFRRIRPQYDETGGFLRPYSSGLIGRARPRENLQETYYSAEELQLMERLL